MDTNDLYPEPYDEDVELAYGDDGDECIEYIDRRLFRTVDIDPHVEDVYMPLVGAAAFGLYTAYMRLSSQQRAPGVYRNITSVRYAEKICRLSKDTVTKYNRTLEDCGLISVEAPTNWQKSRHISNRIALLDPPEWPSEAIITKYGKNKGRDYEPMCAWLYEPRKRVRKEGRGRESASENKDAVAKARPKIRTPIEESASLFSDAMTSSLLISDDSESKKESEYEILSDDDESGASVMSTEQEDVFIRRVQVNLMTAAQQHGWFGSGFNWNKRERELAMENREALTPERITHAVDKWWEIKEPIERFDPCRSFPYIVAVCKNTKDQPDEQQRPKRSGARNGASGGYPQSGYERTVAEPKDDDTDDFPHIEWV